MSVTLEHCQKFSQWYNGNDAHLLTDDFLPLSNYTLATFDPNAAGNVGLFCRYKIQLHIILKLALLLTGRNHITHKSLSSL